MRFVIKAIFFLAVVAAFIPRNPGGISTTEAISGVELKRIDADNLCQTQASLCAAAGESAAAAKLIGQIALNRARTAIDTAIAENASPSPSPDQAQPEAAPAS